MNSVPPIVTQEISERDLDDVSGGLAGAAGAGVLGSIDVCGLADVTLSVGGGGFIDTPSVAPSAPFV
jgi:hypothetical protein